jgi:hypothetical protein
VHNFSVAPKIAIVGIRLAFIGGMNGHAATSGAKPAMIPQRTFWCVGAMVGPCGFGKIIARQRRRTEVDTRVRLIC